MSLVCPLGRALAAAVLFITFVHGQTCYYPGGLASDHVACAASGDKKASACCGEEATCLGNGLCFSQGIMSRGSCTDKDWKDEACATVCVQGLLNSSAPITPCNDTTSVFACGLNETACRRPASTFTLPSDLSIVLRDSEVSAIASPAVSSALANAPTPAAVTVTATPSLGASSSPAGFYSSSEMAGLAVGLAIPLLMSLAVCFSLYRREQARTPRLMYPLPDNMEDPYTMKDGRSLSPYPFARSASAPTSLRPPVSRDGSEVSSITGMARKEDSKPVPLHTFQDRYHLMKNKSGGLQVQRVELDASPEGSGEEFEDVELGDVKKVKPKEQF